LTATDDALTGDKTIASPRNQACLVAELAGAADRAQTKQLDVWRDRGTIQRILVCTHGVESIEGRLHLPEGQQSTIITINME
jgi:hypothetical protein